jgi:type I restriction enzyme R subunit
LPQPEQQAREEIDQLLASAGWEVCDPGEANISAYKGIAIREFPLDRGHGCADYLLYVDGKAAGVIEAKKQGSTLIGVETQSAKYISGLPESLPAWKRPLLATHANGLNQVFVDILEYRISWLLKHKMFLLY